MSANTEEILNQAAGKNSFIILTSARGEISASSLGYDTFTGFKVVGTTNATLKAKSVKQITISSVVVSDLSQTGAYGGAAEEFLVGDSVVSDFEKITVSTGRIMAFLGRKVDALIANRPD